MRRGYFISVEGIDGSGKSTHVKFIQQLLEASGKTVTVTREPGGTMLGEQIREILLTPRSENISANTELLLIFAARIEHVQKIISPSLAAGKWVLCERFTDASYAYQGGGRGLPVSDISVLENWALGCFDPDLTLIFDLPASIGMKRALARSQQLDRFEQEQVDFVDRVRMTYLSLAKENLERYCLIDASLPLAEVQKAIKQKITAFLDIHSHV